MQISIEFNRETLIRAVYGGIVQTEDLRPDQKAKVWYLGDSFSIRSPAKNCVSPFFVEGSRCDFLRQAYRVISVLDPLSLSSFSRI